MSTWDMIHPPKMSPCWLASAGMGTTRSTGSLSSGSVTGSSVTPAGLLDDALQGGARVNRAGLQRLAEGGRRGDLRQARRRRDQLRRQLDAARERCLSGADELLDAAGDERDRA